jgi:sulfur carrier protein
MILTINGKDIVYNEGKVSLVNVLEQNGVKNPDIVTVQLNGNFVQKQDFDKTELKDKDEVDFLYFMGGG